MLRMLKNQMRGILIATILLIIPSFVLFYGARQTGRRADARHAGEIFGRNISHEEYRQSLQWAYISARLRYGEQLESIQQFLNLEQEAWQNLILAETAGKRGIIISDEELSAFITSMPMFLAEDGHFDYRLYHNILTYALGVRPEQFENFMRRSIAIARLQEAVVDGIRATDAEVRGFYSFFNEKARVKYVGFLTSEFHESVDITDQMLKEYFERNPHEFRQPETRKIEHVSFTPDISSEHAADDEIEAYYNRNINQFLITEENEDAEPSYTPLSEVRDEIKSRIIASKASNSAMRKAEELNLEIEEGFVYWEDIDREETDFFSSDYAALPRTLVRSAFAAEPSEITGPHEAEGSFYLIKVTGRSPSYIPSGYEQVIEDVRTSVTIEQARKKAKEKSADFLEFLAHSEGFEDAAEKFDREIREPEPFTRSGRIPGLGAAEEFTREAFSLSGEDRYSSAAIPGGSAVIGFIERIAPDEDDFEEERNRFRTYVESEIREKALSDWFYLIHAESGARLFIDIDGGADFY